MLAHPIEAGGSFTALALNYYLPSFLGRLWDQATTRICADGGANRIRQFFGNQQFKRPDFVVGDFDSIRPDVRREFEQKGSKFFHIYDQDYNDLHKCLTVLKEKSIKDPIVVFGAIGGRLDQTGASFSVALQHPDQRVFFLDENNFSTWIYPRDKGILTPQKWTTKICGLIPFLRPVKLIKTSGLKWDCNFGLGMDTFISSSNEIAEGSTKVLIETSDPILWTCQTKKLKDLPLA